MTERVEKSMLVVEPRSKSIGRHWERTSPTNDLLLNRIFTGQNLDQNGRPSVDCIITFIIVDVPMSNLN